ncbi:bifunctional adenosylcobinamide kinase/adenosylcobinamide-phosphate guanylyltransferase [Methylocystis sp. B8]|uniref:bifunctional adenosylcobinamide kinase/adenosylcobinamide-phosphate guanylyltransferase n=1 Tax=Methylocystis sp. B8 TaxID=544938 RepID=UPI0010FF2607|nr:bifunctional adenosylcobinamide kinase/adenosylcobinamide-phosphate guanylyltransferase [Methylocystis sp. B8]TLG78043.1 bifunctional adenosylcobinamide kinase/adenosylcobinamide-phosphate guanylyltransferase [Methylocystis sp. B8]
MTENPHLTLVLGGARSGKSAYAESIIVPRPAPWTYIATAQILDDEMRARVDAHRLRRGENWRTVEAAQALVEAIAGAPADRPLLIDCLTLWLSNRLLADADLSRDRAELVHALACRSAPTVAVSSEVGLSIVPDNALARSFRDAAGELHQAISKIAGRVALVVAGNPLTVKGPPVI